MDDTDVIKELESQFKADELSEFMDDEMFERFHTLREQVDQFEYLIDRKKVKQAEHRDNRDAIKRLIASLNETLMGARNSRDAIEAKYDAVTRLIKKDTETHESLKRELTRLIGEIEARKRAATQRGIVSELTQTATWRKSAMPYQYEGAYRLSEVKRGILGDAMGLGKTLQSIMAIDMLKALGESRKVLIFCPKPVLDGFEGQFKKWSDNHFVWVLNQTGRGASGQGVKKEVLDVIAALPECIVLTNYEVWRKDRSIIDKLIQCQFDTVILDEAHNLKNASSGTAKGIKEIVHAENKCFKCGALTHGAGCPKCGAYPKKLFDNWSVKNLFPMTGTAILNHPQDLFSLLHLIDPEGFPTEDAFLRDFCRKRCAECGANSSWSCLCDNPRWRWTFKDGGEAKLLGKLGARYTARTRKSAGVKMPPQEVKHWELEYDPKNHNRQQKFLDDLKNRARIEFADGSAITQTDVLAWYSRLRLATEWPDAVKIYDNRRDPVTGEYIGTGELIWPQSDGDLPGQSVIMDWGFERVIEGIENGDRVVVFSQFKGALKEMAARLEKEGVSFVRYDGDLSDSKRREAERDFNINFTNPSESKFQVMLANYKAAGAGLNLSGAHQAVMLGREWNPGKENQAMARIQRMDSKHETIVHIPHCETSATELMDMLIEDKENMITGFQSEVNIVEKMRKFLEGK